MSPAMINAVPPAGPGGNRAFLSPGSNEWRGCFQPLERHVLNGVRDLYTRWTSFRRKVGCRGVVRILNIRRSVRRRCGNRRSARRQFSAPDMQQDSSSP